ncbi:hybrid polyketide synthetase [Dothistroma septosporum NZE10]|uniref:Hybrid PKS-NRPS synthetase 1 n=1 Tax=Dothistroma septosporum (strain NZE10 / CBS 128990) TaxID=675120 RepID=HPS1_DOTSN|nr:RecName: Full=Hybrid PKS-NRPS synthetase 1 [Dothistroma septosporum NZE10]EME39480.1 hybrid polyketide synthetase [Dothistroma septosporum NZE10]
MKEQSQKIAIIGSACRFPGGATSPSKLWQQLVQPQDLLRPVPRDRFALSTYHNHDGTKPGATNVTNKAYLLDEDPMEFDASFFSISPAEAQGMDPQQRQLLEVTYEALESAGYGLSKVSGSSTGVYVGSSGADYRDIQNRDLDTLGRWHATGTASSILANRISHFYGLCGPSLTLDTACSSSLVGLHLAVQAIRNGDCEQALVAGSNLILDPTPYISGSRLKLFSPDAQCRMWDESGKGYGRGEGVAVVLLKPLVNALLDGDHVEAVIRETGVNQDGHTPGITMPSAEAQTNLIRHVYAKAGLDPRVTAPQFFEAHGTGTAAGDPVEARAIYESFFGDGKTVTNQAGAPKLNVGSIKTVIGHLEGAAGIAGLLKATLALQHAHIPPNLLFKKPNPALVPYLDALEVPVTAKQWPAVEEGTPRLASVNSFGFGGTNAHCLIESFPQDDSHPTGKRGLGRQESEETCIGPVVLSAQSGRSLMSAMKVLASYIESNPGARLRDLLHTLGRRRSKLSVRTFFVATSRQELISQLRHSAENVKDATGFGFRPPARLVGGSQGVLGIFTGQGAQWATMGRVLYQRCGQFRASIERCQAALDALPDGPQWSIAEEMLKTKQASRLSEAAVSQPLCTALQIALVDLIELAGLRFDAVVGHSSGEIAACYYMGLITSRDAICIAYYRGVHSSLAEGTNGQKGAMMAVSMTHNESNEFCSRPDFQGRIHIAAHNAPSSVTLSGDADAIFRAQKELAGAGIFARVLKVDTAYHSDQMLPCVAPYLQSLESLNIPIREPRSDCIWVSSVRPDSFDSSSSLNLEEMRSQYWLDNMVQPVLFAPAIAKALRQHGSSFDMAVEIGPHPALAAPAKDTIMEFSGTVPLYTGILERGLDDVHASSTAIALIWQQMTDDNIDVATYAEAFDVTGDPPAKLLKGLPSYEWDHKPYWRESRISRTIRRRENDSHPLLGSRLSADARNEFRWRNILRLVDVPWLSGHVFQDKTMLPLAAQVSMVIDACSLAFPQSSVESIDITDLEISRDILVEAEGPETELLSTLRVVDRNTTADGTTSISAAWSCHVSHDSELGIPESVCICQVQFSFGSGLAASLPRRVSDPSTTTPISSAKIYESFDHDGLQYSGLFNRLSSVSQALGFASASASWTCDELQDHKLHPAVLDVGFQLLMPATFSQKAENACGPYLPRSVACISLRRGFASLKTGEGLSLAIDAFSAVEESSNVLGDVAFYSASGECVIQVESVKLVPVITPDASNDRRIFTKDVWIEDTFDLSPYACDQDLEDDTGHLAGLVDRLCLYYCRQALDNMCGAVTLLSPLRLLHEELQAVIEAVKSGNHISLAAEYAEDSYDSLMEECLPYHDHKALKRVHELGQNLVKIMQGTTSSPRLRGARLDYPWNTELRNAIAILGHRITQKHPNMNILEIGNGDSGMTAHILQSIGTAYLSYTCASPRSMLSQSSPVDVLGNVELKSMNILQEPERQGFDRHKYDLLISSAPIHGDAAFQTALSNMRTLLRPGGYLLLVAKTGTNLLTTLTLGTSVVSGLESIEESNTPAGKSPSELDSLLLACEFSGLEQIVQDSPHVLTNAYSLIASHAASHMFNLVHNPRPSMAQIIDERARILLIGGRSLATARLVRDVRKMLSEVTPHIVFVDSIEKLEALPIEDDFDCLCFNDLDQPLFAGRRNAKTLEYLQKLYGNVRNLLWYTSGRIHKPEASMSIGVGRSLCGDAPWHNSQFIDVSSAAKVTAHSVVEAYCRLALAPTIASSNENLLWSVEPELVIQGDRTLISRVVENRSINDRFNATRRPILREAKYSEIEVCLKQDPQGQVQLAQYIPVQTIAHNAGLCRIRVKYTAALVAADAAKAALCFGHRVGTETPVFAITKQAGSLVVTPEAATLVCENETIDPVHNLSSMALYIQAAICASRAAQEGRTLLFGVREDVIGAVQTSPLWKDKPVIIVVIDSDDRQCADGVIFLHPMSTRRAIRKKLSQQIDMALDCSSFGHDQLWSRVISTLQCRHEKLTAVDFFAESSLSSLQGWLQEAHVAAPQMWHPQPEARAFDILPIQSIGQEGSSSQISSAIVAWQATENFTYRVAGLESEKLFSDSKTYFLAGMTDSLGLSISAWMIRSGAKHLVLAGRDPTIPPQWLEEMSSLGANIKVLTVDICQKVMLTKAVKEIQAHMPPIAGVCNATLVLSDGLLADETFESFDRTLKAKIDGSRNLDQVFSEPSLAFFVLFGSMVSVTGNSGQADYHAANLYMSSLVNHRRSRGLAASIMDTGVVTDVGLVQQGGDAVATMARRQYVEPISEATLHHWVGEAVLASPVSSGEESRIVVGPKRVPRTLDPDLRPAWYSNPRFSHFLIDDASPTSSDSQGSASLLERLQLAASEDHMLAILMEAAQAKLEALLGMEHGAVAAGGAGSLLSFGVDSGVALQASNWLAQEVHVRMPVMKLLTTPNLKQLCLDVMRNMATDLPRCSAKETAIGGTVMSVRAGRSASPGASCSDRSLSTRSDETRSIRTPALASSLQDSFVHTGASTPIDTLTSADSLHSATASGSAKGAPLSPGQAQLWAATIQSGNDTRYNFTLQFDVEGAIDVDRLRSALVSLIAQQEMLRCSFVEVSAGEVQQRVWPGKDLSRCFKHLPPGDLRRAEEEYERLSQHCWQLSEGDTFMLVLTNGPADKHVITLAAHHIIMDGMSIAMFFRLLALAYEGQHLPVLQRAYTAYAEEHVAELAADRLDDKLEFWKTCLSPLVPTMPVFPMAISGVRKALDDGDTGILTVKSSISAPVVDRIKSMGRKLRCTPFHFMTTALIVLCAKMLHLKDICIGVTDAGRLDERDGETVGHFADILPLRTRVEPGTSMADLVPIVLHNIAQAAENAGVPFSSIVRATKTPRSATHSPIFQVGFNFLPGDARTQFGASTMQWRTGNLAQSLNDVSWWVHARDDGSYTMQVDGRSDLYSLDGLDLLMQTYKDLAETLCTEPNTNLERLRTSSDQAIKAADEAGLGQAKDFGWETTLPDRFDAMAEKYFDQRAAVDSAGGVTYEELRHRVHDIAAALQDSGSAPGAAVAVITGPSVNTLASMLAIIRIRCVYVPLDLSLPHARHTAMIKDCGARVLLFEDSTAERASALRMDGMEVVNVFELLTVGRTQREVSNLSDPHEPAILLYTSGSTSVPKGVVLSQAGFLNYVAAKTAFLGLEREMVLQQSSISFDMGLAQMLHSFCNGGTLVIVPQHARGDPVATAQIMLAHHITFTVATPTEYTAWLSTSSHTIDQYDQWRHVCYGGEFVTDRLSAMFRQLQRQKPLLNNSYGPTETSCATTLCVMSEKGSPAMIGYVGKPLANSRIRIVDQDGQPLPLGHAGEICIGGPGLAVRYVNPDDTRNRFIMQQEVSSSSQASTQAPRRLYRTGDRGKLLVDGSLILLGRMEGDTQVKMHGLRIDVTEVEHALLNAIPDFLAEAIVTMRGAADNAFLVAHVVMSAGITASKGELQLLTRLLRLPRYMLPKSIIAVDGLPTTTSGKIDRRAISQLPLEAPGSKKTSADQLVEAEVLRIWREVLGEEAHLDSESDFFSVGGDSLLVIKLQAGIKALMGLSISLAELYETSTLREMAEKMASVRRTQPKPSLIDWDAEVQVPTPIAKLAAAARPDDHAESAATSGTEVVLTGAADLLGYEILVALLNEPSVRVIHCVAIAEGHGARLPSDARVVVYPGSLRHPTLSLSDEERSNLQDRAHAIIHAGAEGHCLNNYATLRSANLLSTQFLAQIALPRCLPVHFVSGTRVTLLSGTSSLPPLSVASYRPAQHGHDGYTATKWASEVFFEALTRLSPALPVTIHRPCALTGMNAAPDNVMNALVRCSAAIKAVPRNDEAEGYVDFKDARTVAHDMVEQVLAGLGHDPQRACSAGVRFIHHSSGHKVPARDLGRRMEMLYGGTFRKLEMGEWIALAKASAGLHYLAATFLEAMMDKHVTSVYPYMGEEI